MTVYVVELGNDDSRCVGGVFATADAAMAAYPIPEKPDYGGVGVWTIGRYGTWTNGLDMSDYVSIEPYEVGQ